jgi:predicted transcriptional regulator
MDALHAIGEGDVGEVRARLVDASGYDSIRTILRILCEKGHVRRRREGRRHVYRPTQHRAGALRTAWANLVATFFQGSYEDAAATLLRASDSDLSERRLTTLLAEIERAKMKKE